MKARFVRGLLSTLSILLLLGSSGADAFALHRCAHHDAVPSVADHGEHDQQHAHDPAPGDESESHGCTCVGTCATSTTALAPALHAQVAGDARSMFVARAAAPALVLPASTPHRLPFATAPPPSF